MINQGRALRSTKAIKFLTRPFPTSRPSNLRDSVLYFVGGAAVSRRLEGALSSHARVEVTMEPTI